MTTNDLRAEALRLAENGLRIFPCVERGKEPLITDNLKRATTDKNVINGWWSSRRFNIGIATGAGSGIWVLDIDGDEGEETLRQLESKHGNLPVTVEVITGAGRHLYFRWPTGTEIRNTQCRLDLPGLDVRGEGGYVLGPPSRHPSGRTYTWSVDSADAFEDAPDWLIDLVTRGGTDNADVQPTPPEAWRSFIGQPVDGSRRGAAVARLSGLLLRRYLDPVVALDLTRLFNAARCDPPLDDVEVVGIVTAICSREQQRREGQP
jgi:putative DNA primase/helicase